MLAIAVPVAFQQLITASLNMVDVLMVGQLGESSIAAAVLNRQGEAVAAVNISTLRFALQKDPLTRKLIQATVDCAARIDYRDLVPYMRLEEGFVETLETLANQIAHSAGTVFQRPEQPNRGRDG